MTLDSLIAEIDRLGYSLRLSGPLLDRPLRYRWEATVTRALDDGTFAVGFHPSSDPTSALSRALDRCANDFEIHQPEPIAYAQPTCVIDSLAPLLSNLLSQPAQPVVLSPLKFKFKT